MNQRARIEPKKTYNYDTTGCYGRYLIEGALPIEFLSTTMSIDEISKLTFAKDIRTDLDFELLIQRDIDENRAIKEIGKYISPENGTEFGTLQNNGVFLPPLIAAIVNTKDGKTLSRSYPKLSSKLEKDTHGDVITREWNDLFKVSLYPSTKGENFKFEDVDGKTHEELIDIKFCKLEAFLGHADEKGGRLVVIDGQHRLFALDYLRKHSEYKDKVSNLVIPVCILYSPESTDENVENNNTPTIPDVLRKLFVDVNNNAKTVSGHFRILLSNDNIGQMLCNSLCASLLDNNYYNGNSLSLLEWNTKSDKESKTISKPYSISSIGVIFDALHDLFKTRAGKHLLTYILNIDEIAEKLEFGVNAEGEPNSQSRDFPWRDIPYASKDLIREQVNNYLTPCIKEIFFETPCYKNLLDVFIKSKTEFLVKKSKEASTESKFASLVLDHLEQFEPINNTNAKALFSQFVELIVEGYSSINSPDIIRANVFQKGLLTAWFNFLTELTTFNVRPLDATKVFCSLLQHSIDINLFENDTSHLYLQESIFDGIRIKPTKDSRLQISKLILSCLGQDDVVNALLIAMKQLDSGINGEKFKEKLLKLGDKQATIYLNNYHSQLVKSFSKEYKSNTDLIAQQISELVELESLKELSKKEKRIDSSIDLDERFDEKVKEYIKTDFELGKNQLDRILGFSIICDELIQEEEDLTEE